jgi:hypothetical protein
VSSASRPINNALQSAGALLTGNTATRPFQRYVLLITDGSPNNDCSQNDCIPAVMQVPALTAQGIRLAVIGMGDQSALGCPKNLVTAAGDLGDYYPAMTDADLQSALGQVMAGAACNLTLNPAPSSNINLQVSINGTPAPYQDGWTYSNGHLHLRGSACGTYISAGTQALTVRTLCDTGHSGPNSGP